MIITKDLNGINTRSNSIDSSSSNSNDRFDLNFAFDEIRDNDSIGIDSEDSLDDDVLNLNFFKFFQTLANLFNNF